MIPPLFCCVFLAPPNRFFSSGTGVRLGQSERAGGREFREHLGRGFQFTVRYWLVFAPGHGSTSRLLKAGWTSGHRLELEVGFSPHLRRIWPAGLHVCGWWGCRQTAPLTRVGEWGSISGIGWGVTALSGVFVCFLCFCVGHRARHLSLRVAICNRGCWRRGGRVRLYAIVTLGFYRRSTVIPSAHWRQDSGYTFRVIRMISRNSFYPKVRIKATRHQVV